MWYTKCFSGSDLLWYIEDDHANGGKVDWDQVQVVQAEHVCQLQEHWMPKAYIQS